MSMKDFEIIEKLGSGSFSTVFKVKRHSDGQIYALKQVKMGMLSLKEKENALNEIRILASINSPHVVQFKDCFLDQKTNYLCIVLEFCEGGDITNQIKQHIKKQTYFNEQRIWEYLIQLLKGLKALHQLTILHRDIKCANIFLQNSKCKLGDLNVSKVSKNNLVQTQTGTPYYTAPEIWRDQKYDGKCDIWSLGCVIYEIAALQPPFKAQNMQELNSKIQAGKYPLIPKIYSTDLNDIINQCLKVRPQLRPTAEELLNHPIIQQHDKKGQILQGQNVRLSKQQLLATIKLPRNLGALKEKLPKPNYQQKLNSSFEKKVGLEVILEADSQKIPDFIYKERIQSARAKRKIDIYSNIQKEQLKQQKIEIEKQQQELKKKLLIQQQQQQKYQQESKKPPIIIQRQQEKNEMKENNNNNNQRQKVSNQKAQNNLPGYQNNNILKENNNNNNYYKPINMLKGNENNQKIQNIVQNENKQRLQNQIDSKQRMQNQNDSKQKMHNYNENKQKNVMKGYNNMIDNKRMQKENENQKIKPPIQKVMQNMKQNMKLNGNQNIKQDMKLDMKSPQNRQQKMVNCRPLSEKRQFEYNQMLQQQNPKEEMLNKNKRLISAKNKGIEMNKENLDLNQRYKQMKKN